MIQKYLCAYPTEIAFWNKNKKTKLLLDFSLKLNNLHNIYKTYQNNKYDPKLYI